jgi:aminopeptidase N
VIATFLSIDGLYWGLGGRQVFDSCALRILGPIFDGVGWDRRPGEPDNVAILREQLITALGRLGDPAVIGEARKRFAAFLADPDDPGSLSAAIRQPVLEMVGLTADAGLYDQLHRLATTTVDPVAKEQYFVSLAEARDKGLAQRSLEMALGNDPATTTGPLMISTVAAENAPLAWSFVIDHLADVMAKLDSIQRVTLVPSIGAQCLDKSIQAQLRKFIDDKVPEANRDQVERFYAGMVFRLSVREQRVPEIDAWLAANGFGAGGVGAGHPS